MEHLLPAPSLPKLTNADLDLFSTDGQQEPRHDRSIMIERVSRGALSPSGILRSRGGPSTGSPRAILK
jgi:hypothetical protein